jgi:3,5-epimerase/4-reductase
MRVLVYGAKGWIGQQFIGTTTHEVILGTARAENYYEVVREIKEHRPDTVCSFLGRTHGYDPSGNYIPTIDYLELPGKEEENHRDNFLAPITLAEASRDNGVHFVYLGTGCIYTYRPEKDLFSEMDEPNFFGSAYSKMKGLTNQAMHRRPNALQLRIRMPISRNVSKRNLIDKLVGYKQICSIPNSMTVLDDMWAPIDAMITAKTTGTYNLVNPGVVDHSWILTKYRDVVDPTHTWSEISYEDQMKILKSERSNNELTTDKLEDFCADHGIPLPDIRTSILHCLKDRALGMPSQTQ